MLSRIFFILTVVVIFCGLNYFFFWHFSRYYGVGSRSLVIVLSLLFALQLPLSMALHNAYPNAITRAFYFAGAAWLGFIFLGFVLTFLFDITVNLLRIPLLWKAILWSVLLVAVTGFAIINQARLEIRPISIKVKGLKNDIRIGYISDVHIDGIHNLDYLDRIIDRLNEQEIDLVLINGDIIDGTSFEKHSLKTLDRLKVPVFVTFGNHEHYIGIEYAKSLFKGTKARVLENEVVEFSGIQILGIEDMMGMKHSYNEARLREVLGGMKWNHDAPSLMLLHEPLGSEIADTYGIDVQLAGHTHSGQIWPFDSLVRLVFSRYAGLYTIGGLTLYVGPGTGVWGPPMRLGSRNEITIITLEKK